MSEDLARAFVSFLAIIDPIGNVLVFYVLTRALSFPRQLQVAAIAVLVAAAMLILFSLWGREVLDLLDISQGSFKVAAGSLLLLPAYQLVVHGQSMVISEEHGGEPVEIALVPFATPLLAGPGALATATSFFRDRGARHHHPRHVSGASPRLLRLCRGQFAIRAPRRLCSTAPLPSRRHTPFRHRHRFHPGGALNFLPGTPH